MNPEGSGIRVHGNTAPSAAAEPPKRQHDGSINPKSPTAIARRRGTLRSRIVKFFENNPDEELTRADMLKKFVTSVGNLDNVLLLLKAEGVLEKPMTYRLKRQPDMPPATCPYTEPSVAQAHAGRRQVEAPTEATQ